MDNKSNTTNSSPSFNFQFIFRHYSLVICHYQNKIQLFILSFENSPVLFKDSPFLDLAVFSLWICHPLQAPTDDHPAAGCFQLYHSTHTLISVILKYLYSNKKMNIIIIWVLCVTVLICHSLDSIPHLFVLLFIFS